jgi:hypothetical protein
MLVQVGGTTTAATTTGSGEVVTHLPADPVSVRAWSCECRPFRSSYGVWDGVWFAPGDAAVLT